MVPNWLRPIMGEEVDTENSKENILREADRLIHGDRNKQYGHPLDNHTTTAEFWNIYLKTVSDRGKVFLDTEDVCFLNILQKISREATTGARKRDTITDIAGYAGNIEMCREEQERRSKE